jgi:NADH-quinone oxidoreductase subunit C
MGEDKAKLPVPESPDASKPENTASSAQLNSKADSAADLRTAPATPSENPVNPAVGGQDSPLAQAGSPSAAVKPPGATGTAGTAAPKPPVKKKDEGPVPQDASNDELVVSIKEAFENTISEAIRFLGQLSIAIERAQIVNVCRFLRDHETGPFNYLSDLTCVHRPEREAGKFELVYNLYSIPANRRVRLKVLTDEEVGVESVTGIWPSANWMEREVFDLFGIKFHGHPDLRRLLLPSDWEGHPLRKDYPLEFVENNWTANHLPEFTEVQREQVEQRRAYGLDALSIPEERIMRDLMRGGKEIMPLDRK